jgi:hypothetical protein
MTHEEYRNESEDKYHSCLSGARKCILYRGLTMAEVKEGGYLHRSAEEPIGGGKVKAAYHRTDSCRIRL